MTACRRLHLLLLALPWSLAQTDLVAESGHEGERPAALEEDDACNFNGELASESESCALSALQRRAATLKDVAQQLQPGKKTLGMKKLPRLQNHREPHGHVGTGVLTGAAWADFAVEVSVGGQKFRVIVDTGSSTFAIPAGPLAGCEVYYRGTCHGDAVTTRYGSANWTGQICDGVQVTMAGLSAGKPEFAGIMEQSNFLTECSSIPGGIVSRGIVGMAYASLLGRRRKQTPLFDAVVANTGIRNIFSMQCCPWTGIDAGAGSLTLGGWDESLYRAEDFTYTPITMEKWFCISMRTLFLDGFEHHVKALRGGPELDDDDDADTEGCSDEPVGSCSLVSCQAPATCDLGSLTCRCPAGQCSRGGQCEPESLESLESLGLFQEEVSHPAKVERSDLEARAGNKSVGHIDWGLDDAFDWLTQSRRRRTQQRCQSIIDSGTSAMILRKDVYKGVLKSLNEVARRHGITNPCITEQDASRFPDIIARFESVHAGSFIELRIPSTTYFQVDIGTKCRKLYLSSSGVLNSGLGEVPDFILGQPLMEAYYTVFDKENRRIGFAPQRGCS